MRELDNILEEKRKAKNLSQEQLAKILKVSRQTINALEKGRYNPSIVLAFELANFFECLIEDIFIYNQEEKEAD